jgi:phosphoribosyl 1,2-cyclic phosphodiesterase
VEAIYGESSGCRYVIVTFHGVRGSTPCHSEDITRHGGNTACVSVRSPGEHPLLFDLGTGLRYFAESIPNGDNFDGTCLLSHLHWDHVQGLPFFKPLLRPGSRLAIHAPTQFDGRHPGEVLLSTIRPPLFPISLDEFNGDVTVYCAKPQFNIGSYVVHSGVVPHNGAMAGYRVERGEHSVTYISDHQQPEDPSEVAESVLELCRGVDLLIHDAQYTPSEFEQKRTWGHCTVQYAVAVAIAAKVKRLALFHHDPSHDDEMIERMTSAAQQCAAAHGIEVFAATEGASVDLSAS